MIIQNVISDLLYEPSREDVERLLSDLDNKNLEDLKPDLHKKVTLCLSYISLNSKYDSELIGNALDKFICFSNDPDGIVDWLISTLKPMLLKLPGHIGRQNNNNIFKGIKPNFGTSLREEEIISTWKKKGGLRSIPLFYVVLCYLNRAHLSQNISWIIPGILNLLDDTSDIANIKLQGVLLLRTFAERCFINQEADKWITFQQTGIYDLTISLIRNMCFYLPPSYKAEETQLVWEYVFPAINALNIAQSCSDDEQYKKYTSMFLADVVLTIALPRVADTYEGLASYLLDYLTSSFGALGSTSLLHLSRTIYVLGEYFVRSPFFTTSEVLMRKTFVLLDTLVQIIPVERVVAHKYDFLSLLLIGFDKCQYEGALSDNNLTMLRSSLKLLSSKASVSDNDIKALVQRRPKFRLLFDAI